MRDSAKFYADFIRRFVNWAENVEDICAALIMGSRARTDHPADEWSDLDLFMYTENPAYYLADDGWIKCLGDVISTFVYRTAGNDPERLSLFRGGYQVDIVVFSVEQLHSMTTAEHIPYPFYRGVQVILDKEGLCGKIMPEHLILPEAAPVKAEKFEEIVSMFWFMVLYIAKQILRNELWIAKAQEAELRRLLLLPMLEWHAKAAHGKSYDTWHAGRFISEWADRDILDNISKCFSEYGTAESWNALLEEAKLFSRTSAQVAAVYGFSLHTDLESHVMAWIERHIQ